jgi:hypothetical protein
MRAVLHEIPATVYVKSIFLLATNRKKGKRLSVGCA